MRSFDKQEKFWMGEFGTSYLNRNSVEHWQNRANGLWKRIFANMQELPNNILELGCNIGINLLAINNLLPSASLTGVEINSKAAGIACKKLHHTPPPTINILQESIFDGIYQGFDFAFTCGVLIHIDPEKLSRVYNIIHNSSVKYICMVEYYNPFPVEVSYRGNSGVLFKRDFAGEFLSIYKDMQLEDYGFVYHLDPVTPEDDLTWFLMKNF